MTEVKFSNPPLTEVVCGVAFDTADFSSVHYGLYWAKIRDRFSSLPTDQPPVYSGAPLNLSALPPLRRVWFESEDKRDLVQVQADRFYYNWRKQGEEDNYPRFKDNVYPNFTRAWKDFYAWWTEDMDSLLVPVQYELSYINQIDKNFGWKSSADHRKIFTFEGRNWDGVLGIPNNHVFVLDFTLPDNLGNLSVSGKQGFSLPNDEPVMVLELTARSLDTSLELDEWFERAHSFIVRGFLDLTTSSIHKEWGINE